jgi:hypothetical protein
MMNRPQPGERITIEMAKAKSIGSVKSQDYTTGEKTLLWLHTLEDINGQIYSFLNKNVLVTKDEFITIVGTVKNYIHNNIIRLQRVKVLQHHKGVTENA